MRPGSGKRKGNSFEREICVKLSLWITHGKSKDVLWRSAMSGGRATRHGKAVRQAADICAVAPEGHVLTDRFAIECKHVRDLNLWGIVTNRGLLHKFWLEICAVAARHGKKPLLIAKQNNSPVILCSQHNSLFGINENYLVTVPRWGLSIYKLDDVLKRKFVP